VSGADRLPVVPGGIGGNTNFLDPLDDERVTAERLFGAGRQNSDC